MSKLKLVSMLVLALIIAGLFFCQKSKTLNLATTLVIINGTIWTGNPNQPRAEAIAVANDKILAVGSTAEIKKLITF